MRGVFGTRIDLGFLVENLVVRFLLGLSVLIRKVLRVLVGGWDFREGYSLFLSL